jgi:hypothetical protein
MAANDDLVNLRRQAMQAAASRVGGGLQKGGGQPEQQARMAAIQQQYRQAAESNMHPELVNSQAADLAASGIHVAHVGPRTGQLYRIENRGGTRYHVYANGQRIALPGAGTAPQPHGAWG